MPIGECYIWFLVPGMKCTTEVVVKDVVYHGQLLLTGHYSEQGITSGITFYPFRKILS